VVTIFDGSPGYQQPSATGHADSGDHLRRLTVRWMVR
jgi:hypothetical protein